MLVARRKRFRADFERGKAVAKGNARLPYEQCKTSDSNKAVSHSCDQLDSKINPMQQESALAWGLLHE